MFKNFFSLKKNIVSFQGKIEFVTYVSALVLFCLHLFYLGFYIYEKIYPMIAIDVIGVAIYVYYLYKGIKNSDFFDIVCYLCILVHTVMAIICLGW